MTSRKQRLKSYFSRGTPLQFSPRPITTLIGREDARKSGRCITRFAVGKLKMRVMPVTIRTRAGAGLNCNDESIGVRMEARLLHTGTTRIAETQNAWQFMGIIGPKHVSWGLRLPDDHVAFLRILRLPDGRVAFLRILRLPDGRLAFLQPLVLLPQALRLLPELLCLLL